MKWYLFKEPVVAFFGISKDALHIHFGLAGFVGIAVLCRRRFRHPLLIGWLSVFLLEIGNEALDYFDWNMFRHDMPSDIINTMLWPTFCCVAAWLYGRS